MSRMSRRELLAKAGLTTVAGAGLVTTVGAPVSAKSNQDYKRLTIVVDLKRNIPAFDGVREPQGDDPFPTGPYYVPGDIYPEGSFNESGDLNEGAGAVGNYTSWGWIYDPTTGASARTANFVFSGAGGLPEGSIVIEGDRSPVSESGIISGTGGFRRAQGVYRLQTLSSEKGAFIATFDVFIHRR